MMSDLIERLRDERIWGQTHLRHEAADEIERLQRKLDDFMAHHEKHHLDCEIAAYEALELDKNTSTYKQVQVNEYEDEPEDFDVYREEVWKNEHS
jgi:hypothetical protein